MDQLTLLLALFAATVLLAPVAERFTVPYPVLLLVLGLLVAFVSVVVAPIVQRAIGTVPAIIATLVLFAADMLMMAIWADHAMVVTIGIIASGAFIGNNNTLITEAVMGAAPVERPVASAAYSFVRFCGGAVGPYVALKLFGEAPDVHVHAPFWFGAASVVVGVVILTAGARTVARALSTEHAETSIQSEQEAEAVLVGDLD